MQPDAGILSGSSRLPCITLTYDIVLRRLPWISRSISRLVNGAATGTTYCCSRVAEIAESLFSASFDTVHGQLELREEADVFCRSVRLWHGVGGVEGIWTFDIRSLLVSAFINACEETLMPSPY